MNATGSINGRKCQQKKTKILRLTVMTPKYVRYEGLRVWVSAFVLLILLFPALMTLIASTAYAQPIYQTISATSGGVYIEVLVFSRTPAYEGQHFSVNLYLQNLIVFSPECTNITLLPSPQEKSMEIVMMSYGSSATASQVMEGSSEEKYSDVYVENEDEIFTTTGVSIRRRVFNASQPIIEKELGEFWGMVRHGTVGKQIKLHIDLLFEVRYKNGSSTILEVKNGDPITIIVMPGSVTIPMELIIFFATVSILMILFPIVVLVINRWRMKRIKERRLLYAQ